MPDTATPPPALAPRRSTRGFRVAVVALSSVILLAIAATVTVLVLRGGGGTVDTAPESRIVGTVPGERTGFATLWELRAGDCLLDIGTGVNLFALVLVACDEAHRAEIWGEVPVPDDWGMRVPANPAEATAWLEPWCLKEANRVVAVNRDMVTAFPGLMSGAFGWSPTRFEQDGMAGLCAVTGGEGMLTEYLYQRATAVWDPPDDAEIWGTSRRADVIDLVGGDCLEGPADWAEIDLADIQLTPCNEPHSGEVWMRLQLPDAWLVNPPTDDQVGEYVVAQCRNIGGIAAEHNPVAFDGDPSLTLRPLPWRAAYAVESEQAGLCAVTSERPLELLYFYPLVVLALQDWADERKPREAP